MQRKESTSPLMQQYFAIKKEYPEGLIFFQVGDFYELFFEDASIAAAALAITLTARGKNKGEPIPLCGVPVHAKDYYVSRLVKAGFKVVICDQLEPATPGKVVARGVTHVLTPGTLTEQQLLNEKSASYISVIALDDTTTVLIFAELLSGSLWLTGYPNTSFKTIEYELGRFIPDEIIFDTTNPAAYYKKDLDKLGYCVTPGNAMFDAAQLQTWLYAHKLTIPATISEALVLNALASLFSYLSSNKQPTLDYFKQVYWYESNDFLLLDTATQRNLELIRNAHDGTSKNTLLSVMDKALTSMGSRLIKKWLLRPLVDQKRLEQRYDVLDFFFKDLQITTSLQSLLKNISDIERALGRIGLKRASGHDYQQLLLFLPQLPILKNIFSGIEIPVLLKKLLSNLNNFESLEKFLSGALELDSKNDRMIKPGFSHALDAMRELQTNGTQHIFALEAQERATTGISSLKINYNTVQGYAIEITKTHSTKIPGHYIRLQTLVAKERFTIPALQSLEAALLHAHNQAQALELQLFEQVKQEVSNYLPTLMRAAGSVATLDALLGLWSAAYENNYVRPVLTDDNSIVCKNARHPVIEQVASHAFVANDITFDSNNQVLIITGPNMGGKSTYLRQTALICIMAQVGSFVPASSAQLSLRDRIFTRIGASDNVSAGKSTFLVEMEETALICRYATPKSLVILDEVGRGTSTFDGLAIAQAVVEYCRHALQAPTMFATHYHELTALADKDSAIKCLYAESTTLNNAFHLTFNIKPGVATGSFGLEVAKVAGLPEWIINRAQELWKSY